MLRTFILTMFAMMRCLLDYLIDTLFGLYYNSRVQTLGKTENPLLLESATSLARKIQKRQITSEEIVRAFVDQAKNVNKILNAVVDERYDDAIKEAQQIDKDLATGNIIDADFNSKPFLGIPFTSKETTACKDMSYTFGLIRRRGKTAHFDADVIDKMKKAGGILIAVTNVPQLNLWQETSNPIFGTTCNPYNSTRNVGGSSGGEASIIAACGSAIGIGTDIGGSLRIPAFMCGIYGHKPTTDLISTNGLTFRTGKEKDTMVVAGPMTKKAEDIAPLLRVLLGSNCDKLRLNEQIPIRDIKVHYVSDPKDILVSPFRTEMRDAFEKVVKHFSETQNDKPKDLYFDEFRHGGKLWKYWMSQEENANFNYDIANREEELGSVKELVKYFLGQSEFGFAVILVLLNGLLPKVKEDWAKQQTESLRRKLIDTLGTNGVLLYPSAPWPASYHGTAFLRPWNFNLFAIWNALKLPVTQVPLGLSKEGLPIGIQVVSAPYQDHLCIAVAKELESAFGGYVPPFPVTKV